MSLWLFIRCDGCGERAPIAGRYSIGNGEVEQQRRVLRRIGWTRQSWDEKGARRHRDYCPSCTKDQDHALEGTTKES